MLRPTTKLLGLAAASLAVVAATALTPLSTATAADPGPVLGVYRGAGSTGVTRVKEYEAWSGTSVNYVLDFAADDSWSSITGPNWQLDPWRNSGKRLVYSIPLFPKPSIVPGGSLENCAAGSYNGYWSTLAKNLVLKQLEDTIVRPGWEFNGSWFSWTAKDKPAAFATCFRNVVTTMRAVAGQQFEFDWNPNIGPASVAAELAYPGDAYVDYIGIDIYDQSWVAGTYPIPSTATYEQKLSAWKTMWSATVNGDHGLAFWSSFARQHGKRLSMPEWGLTVRSDGHGGGDNPYYIEQTFRWLRDPVNNVAYALYFDFDASDGTHRVSRPDELFKTAATKYLGLLRPPVTAPSPSPVSSVTSPSPSPASSVTSPSPSPASSVTSPSPSPVSSVTSPSPSPVSSVTSPSPSPASRITCSSRKGKWYRTRC